MSRVVEALLNGESAIVDLSVVVTLTLDLTVVEAVCRGLGDVVVVVNFGLLETSFSSQIGFSHPKRQIFRNNYYLI